MNEIIAYKDIIFESIKHIDESENDGLTPETIWYADDVGTNDTSKKEILGLFFLY